ncbi:hypothetical protein SAMN04487981_108149 [Streptomyces sp. cf386]|nr:hypothetical protein SAMN04487981_108149 [Streptomyces sp. cf386]
MCSTSITARAYAFVVGTLSAVSNWPTSDPVQKRSEPICFNVSPASSRFLRRPKPK